MHTLEMKGDEPMPRFLMRRRSLPKWKRRLVLMVTLLFISVVLTYLGLSVIERNVEPVLKAYVDTRVKQVAIDAVREALREQVVSQQEFEDIIRFVRDDKGQVQGVVIDQYKQARLHEETLAQIQTYLKHDMGRRLHEQGLDKMDVYLGQVFKSRLFADKGPSIPVTFMPKGAVELDLNPQLEAAGINNILITLMLDIQLDVSVIVPFPTDPMKVRTHYPLATALVIGDTPQWYWHTSGATNEWPTIPGLTPEGALDWPAAGVAEEDGSRTIK